MALIINPQNGEILTTDDPRAYYAMGYRDATPEELEHSARVEEFGSFEQQAQAQAERVVRGATFGAVEGFGDDPEAIRARAEVSEELSPVTSFVANVAPDLGVAALTGGIGGLATGTGRAAARAALAEGAGLVRAGLAAGRAGGAAALAAESLGTAAVGAGQQAYAEGRDLFDDPGADAENALIWGGLNFGLGAFMMRGGKAATREILEDGGELAAKELDDIAAAAEVRAAAELPEEAIPGTPGQIFDVEGAAPAPGMRWEQTAPAESVDEFAARQAAERGAPVPAGAVRQGEREAVDGGVERALRNASKSDAADVVERAIGAEPVKEADSFGRQRRLYINREAIREVAAKEMQKDLSELVENVRQVASVEKQAVVAASVSDNLPAQRAVAKGVAKQAAEFVGQLKAEAKAYGAAAGKKGLQYAIPGQRDLALSLMDHAKEIAQATNGKALFEALDGFKRAAQEHKLSLEKGLLNSESAIHYEKLIPRVETFANSIRNALEDSTTWGKAGEMQRAYNAVISDKLIPHMKVFESAVLKRTHQGYDGLWKTEGWESKIAALLKDADPGNRRHVLAVLDGMDELAAVQRKFGSAKEADKLGAQVAKVRRTIGLGDELADAEERMHALGQIIGGGPLGGFLAGGLAGGLPGAIIGGAIPGAVRGLVMGDLIQAFQRLSGATDAAVSRGVDDWIRSSRVRAGGIREKLPKLPRLSDEAKQLRDVAMRRGITQSMALFQGEDSTPHAAYERLTTKLLDTEAFFNDLAAEYGTLQQEAPDVFMMIAARASVARQFLIDRMPPNVAVSAQNPKGYPPSREAIEDWATYVNAVRYPTRVMGNIGALRVQEVETLRTVHPRAYELLQQRVIEGLARSAELGEQLEDAALARIGILFPELDGLSSPVFSREMGQIIIDYGRAQREASGGGKSSGPLARKMTSPSQGIAQSGATFGQGF